MSKPKNVVIWECIEQNWTYIYFLNSYGSPKNDSSLQCSLQFDEKFLTLLMAVQSYLQTLSVSVSFSDQQAWMWRQSYRGISGQPFLLFAGASTPHLSVLSSQHCLLIFITVLIAGSCLQKAAKKFGRKRKQTFSEVIGACITLHRVEIGY